MSARLFDTTSGAFKDIDAPRIYDSNSKAWIPSIGRTYDKSSNSWIEVFGGISYSRPVELAGLSPLAYGSLDEVFADQVATRQIFTKHASSDYFVSCCALSDNVVDKLVESKYAMKWVGLRDYICDKLMAIPDIQQKMLDSVYWEYILKDHVPIMTSNTAPYGEVSVSSVYSGSAGYLAFNGGEHGWLSNSQTDAKIQYEFVNPVSIKRVSFNPYAKLSGQPYYYRCKAFKIEASNNGTDFDTLYAGETVESNTIQNIQFKNESYYKIYRVCITTSGNDYWLGLSNLQFYGRMLDVSVPVMTSGTAPWGKTRASTTNTTSGASYDSYKAFDGDINSAWQGKTNADSAWIQYDFGRRCINVRAVEYIQFYTDDAATPVDGSGLIQISNDEIEWETIASVELKASEWKTRKFVSIADNEKYSRYVRFQFTAHNKVYNSVNYSIFAHLQFYGVDYSERDDRAYIYDHGVELIECIAVNSNTTGYTTKNEDTLEFGLNSGNGSHGFYNNIDLSDYSLMRCIIGDKLSTTITTNAYQSCDLEVWDIVPNGDYRNHMKASNIAKNVYPLHGYLDISGINESGYIHAGITTAGTYVTVGTIKEWWLEEQS